MAYYDFPHTRNYDTDLGYLIKNYKELVAKYSEVGELLKKLKTIGVVASNVKFFNTTLEMIEEADKLSIGDFTITLGYRDINDGGAALFKIVAETQNLSIDLSLSKKGEYILTDIVNPLMFGAFGDGVNDDTNVLITAINTNKIIDLYNKSYKINNTLTVKNNIANGTIIVDQSTFRAIAYRNGYGVLATGNDNINIDNIKILGNYDFILSDSDGEGPTRPDAIHISHSNITVNNCLIDKIPAIAISVFFSDCHNINVNNCKMTNTYCGVHTEVPNDSTADKKQIRNIKVTNCYVQGKHGVRFGSENNIVECCEFENYTESTTPLCVSGINDAVDINSKPFNVNTTFINCLFHDKRVDPAGIYPTLWVNGENDVSGKSIINKCNVINSKLISDNDLIVSVGGSSNSIFLENCDILGRIAVFNPHLKPNDIKLINCNWHGFENSTRPLFTTLDDTSDSKTNLTLDGCRIDFNDNQTAMYWLNNLYVVNCILNLNILLSTSYLKGNVTIINCVAPKSQTGLITGNISQKVLKLNNTFGSNNIDMFQNNLVTPSGTGDLISNPTEGTITYNVTTHQLCYYNGSTWINL